jgi:hypothetical protein
MRDGSNGWSALPAAWAIDDRLNGRPPPRDAPDVTAVDRPPAGRVQSDTNTSRAMDGPGDGTVTATGSFVDGIFCFFMRLSPFVV